MKTYLKSVRITAFLLATAVAAGAAEGARVLFDLGHGQSSQAERMKGFAQKLGIELVESKAPLASESLAGVRLLYLRAPSLEFTKQEKEVIIGFVRAGGSLLLILDEESRQPLAKTGVNDLVAPFGFNLTPDLPYLHNCGGIAKAGAINRADREIPYSGGRAVEGGTPFAFMLDKDGKPANAFAASTTLSNGGRVVVMGEAMASLLDLGKPEGVRLSGVPRDARGTTYWGKDSMVFMEEVIGWLVKR
jgi:hypothetical protein